MLANAMRGLATEFGLTVSKGIRKLEELMALVCGDETIPRQACQAITGLHDRCHELAEGIETFEAEIVAHARHDGTARRLATIPGIGPITASLIAATVGDISLFKTARQFAAWLGLVPGQNSTGGKTRLGRITKTGNREIRKLLVLGATSMVHRADGWNSAVGAWLRKILERRPVRLVTVALANKMARIAWAVMTRKEVYLLAPVGIRRVLPTKCSNRNPRWAILTGSPTLSSLAIGHRLRRQGLDNAGDPVGLLRCVRRRCLAGQILCQDFCHRHFSTDSHRHRHYRPKGGVMATAQAAKLLPDGFPQDGGRKA